MRNKNKWNRCKAIFGMALLAFTVLGTPATVLPVDAAVAENTVAPCSDDIQWHYKIEQNKLYKRLYNHTACIWLTDWIFVRELTANM